MTTPTPAHIPLIRLYQNWLREQRGLSFGSYRALWEWSVTDLDAFWQSIWDYFALQSPTPHTAVLGRNVMPGAPWFPGAQVNYAQQVFRHVDAAHAAGQPALISDDETGRARALSWPELRRQVASLALHLQAQGVQPGDRVAAYMPNVPETIVAFLATVSIGAVWSVCAPDMGTNAVLDRFSQIEPTVLIAADGVTWAGRDIDRSAVLHELRAKLPSVRHVIVLHHPAASESIADSADWASATARNDAQTTAFEPLWLPFDHPLWIVYSSGTTGLPKPIVHPHGGMVLVALASGLHMDIGGSYQPNNFGERFHWYSSTGWVMWNCQVAGLLSGTTCVIFDGSPGGPRDAPDWGTLWRFAARHGVTFVGSGAAFFAGCAKAGVDLATSGDLSRVRALGSTGSPLSAEVQQWGTDQFARIARTPAQRDIWWFNISGGTDFAGAFIGGSRELPQQAGVMQCRMLGAAVEAWNEAGEPVCWARSASWSARSPFRRCRCGSGTTPTTRATGPVTSRCTRRAMAASPAAATWTPAPAACGATATGCAWATRTAKANGASSTAARTPPSTAMACAWAPAKSTVRWRAWPRCSTRWSSIWSIWAATATCPCSLCCAPAPRWTTR